MTEKQQIQKQEKIKVMDCKYQFLTINTSGNNRSFSTSTAFNRHVCKQDVYSSVDELLTRPQDKQDKQESVEDILGSSIPLRNGELLESTDSLSENQGSSTSSINEIDASEKNSISTLNENDIYPSSSISENNSYIENNDDKEFSNVDLDMNKDNLNLNNSSLDKLTDNYVDHSNKSLESNDIGGYISSLTNSGKDSKLPVIEDSQLPVIDTNFTVLYHDNTMA